MAMERFTPIGGHQFMELKLIEQVERSPRLTCRQAASVMGVSIRLAHGIVTRLIEKGCFDVVKHHSRRWDYYLTPAGLAEKSRLTMEFVDFSMRFYREARRRSAQVCRNLAEAGIREVSFLGAGDLAEISYLGVQEWGLDLVHVYDSSSGTTFMKVPVKLLTEVSRDPTEAIIVCMYDRAEPMVPRYLPPGVPPQSTMQWVFGGAQPSVVPEWIPIL